MSWLKLNDSLNALKGQISNVVQEVLTESVDEDDPGVRLEESQRKVNELTEICLAKENEIVNLRQQVTDLLQKPPELQSTSKTLPDQNASLEDSWFWEPERTATSSSASSKNEPEIISKSPSGCDLTTIPLDGTDSEIIEKLQKKLDEREQKIKKVSLENAILNEKVTQLTAENKECNQSLEELDQQHSIAIENVLQQKNDLQAGHKEMQADILKLRSRNDDLESMNKAQFSDFEQEKKVMRHDFDTLQKKYTNIEKTYVQSAQDSLQLQQHIDRLNEELQKIVIENVDLNARLEQTNIATSSDSEIVIVEPVARNQEDSKRLKELSDRNKELEDTNRGLEEKRLVIQRESKELRDNYNDLLEKFEDLQGKFMDLARNNAEISRRCQDLDSQNVNSANSDNNSSSLISLDRIKSIVAKYFEASDSIDDYSVDTYLDDVLKKISDQHARVNDLEIQLKENEEEISRLVEERDDSLNNVSTLQMEINQCELEIKDCVKNNSLLLMEIDNLKTSKLETISESNEENMIIMEKQLEDYTNLNRSLEDEYVELLGKLDSAEINRQDSDKRLNSMQKRIEGYEKDISEMRIRVECLENEKSNLQFTIDELKAEKQDVVLEPITVDLTDAAPSNQDNSRVVNNLQSQLEEVTSNYREATIQVESLDRMVLKLKETVRKQENLIMERDSMMRDLEEEHETLKIEQSTKEQNEFQLKQDQSELSDQVLELTKEIDELRKSFEQVNHEKCDITNELEELKSASSNKIANLEEVIKTNVATNSDLSALQQSAQQLITEKNELISIVQGKHQENIQYHAEIQRLNQLLNVEVQKALDYICPTCTELKTQLESMKLNSVANEDVVKLNDQIAFLREKSDILTQNIMAEQTNQKLAAEEKSELFEKNQSLSKDLDRLRQHLLEIEDSHTMETVDLQKTIDELKNKMGHLESEAKHSSTAYTSANIRANQQAETLQAQYILLTQQRDDLLAKLNSAEDTEFKNQAALINLQCALEQFQKEKDREIELSTQRIRKELREEQDSRNRLLTDMQSLQQQLKDAKQGLLAASRLSDQLESSQFTVTSLREELTKANETYANLQKKLHDSETNQADKVEKGLIKNLLIGFVTTSPNDKRQILKLISAVLDFNQTESERVGLNKPQSGWLGGFMQSQNQPQSENYNREGLAQAFVKFLEKESQPRTDTSNAPNLLNIMHPPSTASGTMTPQRKISFAEQPTIAAVPILLGENIMPTFAPPRNSSSILKDILSDT